MRIGMLADVYKPHVSGVTHYVELNKRYFEKAGHEVFVFTFGDKFRDSEPRIIRSAGLPLGKTGYYAALSYSRAARELLQTMDIAHVQHPFVTGRLALRYCRPLHIPIVFTNHTRYDLYARTYLPVVPAGISDRVLHAYMPSFCDAVDLVVSPSAGMAGVLRRMGVRSPIEIIPNGVELSRFYEAEPLPRADFGYKPDDILLVYAGRVAFEKNLEFLLRAFADVARSLNNVHLIIIGGGPKPIMDVLHKLTRELGLNDRVRFTGMIPYQELPRHLRMGDAFVTPSVSEVHPLSVIEGMACGLAVAGIRSPGVSDTVEDGKTGLLCAEDISAYSANLMRLCTDSQLRRKMGEAAREASNQYAIERTSRTLMQQYERLVFPSEPRRGSLAVQPPSVINNHLQ